MEIFTKVNAMLCAIRDLPLKAKMSENAKEMELTCTGLVTQSVKVRLARINPALLSIKPYSIHRQVILTGPVFVLFIFKS